MPVVVVGVADDPASVDPSPYDALLATDDRMLEPLLDQVGRHPIAAATLAVLLRDADQRSVDAGLASESAAYSTLQAGPEFTAWRRGRTDEPLPPDRGQPVVVERAGVELRVALNRPHRHNAVTAALRDALTEALALAAIDSSIRSVRLSGNGPSFCSGGDLAEFGSFPDPATAHVTRLLRSPARLAHAVSDRLHVHLHGACMGAGIELAAFAHHVVAAEDTVIALPELGLGLIPGAGGTVSLPRRIGRQRTAALALSGAHLDAATARAWGLVDEIE
jgi:enoyl-CoA hydratase/carnithine racemase